MVQYGVCSSESRSDSKTTSENKPCINWIPSPPSKKIRKYIEVAFLPPQEIFRPLVNVASIENILRPVFSTDDKAPLSDDGLDEFLLASDDLLSITADPLFTLSHILEYDNDLLFACTSGVETTAYIEEAIAEFTGIQVTIKELLFTPYFLLFSINQLKGIASSLSEPIDIQAHSIVVSLSWDLFENSIPIFLKEDNFISLSLNKKETLIKKFISPGDSFNLVPISSNRYPIKFKEISKGFLSQNLDPNILLTISTGELVDGFYLIPIFMPHLLITGSSIADSYFCDRRTAISISYPLCDPEGESPKSRERMQLGNFLHVILEACLIKSDFTESFIRLLLKNYFDKFEEDPILVTFLSSESNLDYIITILQKWASIYFPSSKGTYFIPSETSDLKITKVLSVETPLISITLGILGKIDALILTNTGDIVAMEIKSGRSQQNISHKAQAMLYHSLLCYFFSSMDLVSKSPYALLAYISINQIPSHVDSAFILEVVTPTTFDFISLLHRRNQIAFSISKGGHFSMLPFPYFKFSSTWKCNTCPVSRTCDRLFQVSNENFDASLINFFNSWHSVLTAEQDDLVKSNYKNISLSFETLPFHLTFVSVNSDPLMLLLRASFNNWIDSLRPGDSLILLCDLRFLFPHLIFPIFGCSLLFKSKQLENDINLAIKLPFDHISLLIEVLKIVSPLSLFSPTQITYYLFRNEKKSLGWRAQFSLLLDGVFCNSDFNPIFKKVDNLPLKLPTNDIFNLSIFKSLPNSPISSIQEYPLLEKYLHPAQSACAANWLDCIQLYTKRKTADSQVVFDMSEVLHIVLGMPGCGKTMTLVCFIHQFLSTFPADCRLLITTFTHTAIDVIFEKIKTLFPEDLLLFYRHLSSSRQQDNLNLSKFPEFIDESSISSHLLWTQKDTTNPNKDYLTCRIFFSTVLGLASFPNTNFKFSAVVVDEASQVLLPLSILPLRYAPIAILIGDHCQLRPLLALNSESSFNSYPSFFEELLKLPLENFNPINSIKFSLLKIQFRMNSRLSSICNHLFYSNLMEPGSHELSTKVLNWFLNDSMLELSDFWKDAISIFYPNTLERSLIVINVPNANSNTTSSNLIYSSESQILQSILKVYDLGCDKENATLNISVLAPYHAFLNGLKASLNCMINSKHFYTSTKVSFSTIDSMQGKESDLVILFICNTNSNASSSLMNDPRRFNVALSRASRKLIVIGTFVDTSSLPSFVKQFLTFVKEYSIPFISYPS